MPQEVPYFVKANKVDLPTDINPLRSDAENLLFLQPPLGINSACGQGSGDRGRHSHGEEEEGHSHYFCHRLLQAARATGGEVGATAPWGSLLPQSNAPQALTMDLFCFFLSCPRMHTLLAAADLTAEAEDIPVASELVHSLGALPVLTWWYVNTHTVYISPSTPMVERPMMNLKASL